MTKLKQVYKSEEIKEMVEEVQNDFASRRLERKKYEAMWQLNINFFMGNQFCNISADGEIENQERQFFWQQREVFNHTAPIIETRISKLNRVRPSMTVVPSSSEDKDIYSAKLSRSIIKNLQHRVNFNEILTEGTRWSEICGTSFYKVFWNSEKGNSIGIDEFGRKITDGDVDICAVPPYEIYPESICIESIENQASIIHARAYNVEQVKLLWGVDVEGEDIDVLSLEQTTSLGGLGYYGNSLKTAKSVKHNQVVVIEKYEMPSASYLDGRLIIVCKDKLLHIDKLPFINKKDGTRGYPFIKQVCIPEPACFFGMSIIDRCIPVQRAYNAVKNRKHEFLNRISMGVVAVEDGSVDIENLEEEGLSPGKVVIYRQGSTPPRFLDCGTIPNDLQYEEDRLLQEFMIVAGVSELMRNSQLLGSSNISGVAVQLLVEQDDSRLSTASDQIRFAVKEMAEQSIRLYKQFATMPRLVKVSSDSGEIEMFYFNQSDISSDDVVFETESEISETLAQKRTMVLDLLNAGLLSDENGKLNNRMRAKALELLGFGLWETAQDVAALHSKKADSENMKMQQEKNAIVDDFDDHRIHAIEHTNFLISCQLSSEKKSEKVLVALKEHIKEHKKISMLVESMAGVEEGKQKNI